VSVPSAMNLRNRALKKLRIASEQVNIRT